MGADAGGTERGGRSSRAEAESAAAAARRQRRPVRPGVVESRRGAGRQGSRARWPGQRRGHLAGGALRLRRRLSSLWPEAGFAGGRLASGPPGQLGRPTRGQREGEVGRLEGGDFFCFLYECIDYAIIYIYIYMNV